MVSYVRDLSLKTGKFAQFDVLIKNARKDRIEAVVVVSPKILGDTYDELMTNLNKLASANLLLAIVPPDSSSQN